MGKAVKTILSVAGLAYGAYTLGAGFGAMDAMSATDIAASYAGSTSAEAAGGSMMTSLASSATPTALTKSAGILPSISAETLSRGGQLLSMTGNVMSLKSSMDQASALKTAQQIEQDRIAAENRYQESMAKKQRLDIIEQGRIQEGQMVAGTASSGLSLTGTSPFVGGAGGIMSKTTANLAAVDLSRGASTAISGLNRQAAGAYGDYYSSKGLETGWTAMSTFGKNIFTNSKKIAGGDIYSIFG